MAEDTTEENEIIKPFWSGVVTFGLVSVPVSLFPATRGTTLRLRMVDAEGSFLQRRFFGTDDSKPLDAEDLVRGYEFEKDRFVTVEDDELDALDPEKSREIDLKQFVELDALSPLYFERAYFLVPNGSTTKAYRLLAETLTREERAGIATFVMRGKEYLCAIIAERGILSAQTLRFADEVRSPEAIGLPGRVKGDVAAVARFAKAIKALKVKTLDHAELEDQRSARIVKLAEKKLRAGTDVVLASPDATEVEESSTNVVDLMEVLKERLQGKLRARRAPAGNARKPATAAVDELKSKSKAELYEMAQSMDVRGRSAMSKAKLIEALAGQGH
ncbi:Ku protein [Haliea sp. E1-2-M8]|uniref:non-homologous end joining protein Ku n=1 Tax=Haliea sp. E1-2-M8 TaxID=3064706 RepID=UPI0027220A87|nr:Ku protein [Haliea sp. E1-2-M8]MDO8863554.1 Ku protein [Haliea sp. E1-2-M8]